MKECLLSFFLFACGGQADPPATPPLAALSGQLTSTLSQPLTAPVRATIVWTADAGLLLNTADATEDAAVSTMSRFSLAISATPPGQVLHDGNGYGNVVIYEDRNNNGKFDLAPCDGSQPDLVLGASGATDVNLLWNAKASPTWRAGFYWASSASGELQILPLSHDVSIALTADASLQTTVCNREGS